MDNTTNQPPLVTFSKGQPPSMFMDYYIKIKEDPLKLRVKNIVKENAYSTPKHLEENLYTFVKQIEKETKEKCAKQVDYIILPKAVSPIYRTYGELLRSL